MKSLLRTSDLIYGFMSQVSPEWPRITAASLLTVSNYEKAWQGDLNLFIRLSNIAMEKRKIPGVNKSFYKFIKNAWFGLLEDACLPDKTVLVTMQTFQTAINVCTAALDNLFVHVPRCRALNGHEFQKLPDNFGERMTNSETIWSGFARVTGIGSAHAG